MRSLIALAGILAAVVFVVIVVWAGATYPGYDHLRQYISELGATGAETASAVNLAFEMSGILTALFWIGAMVVLPRTVLTVLGCGLSALNGVSFALAGVYACDFECSRADPSAAAELHDLYGGLGYLAAIVGMAVLAFASTRWPRAGKLWLLGLICTGIGLIGFVGIVIDPEFSGLLQRLAEGAIWVFLLATAAVIYADRRDTSSNRA